MTFTIKQIQCYPIDTEKLNKDINIHFHKGKTDNLTYLTHDKVALIKEPIQAIIDDEFVGGDVDKSVNFPIYMDELIDGKTLYACIPSHEITLTLPQLEPYLNPPISLAEFTKERRGYNSRIRQNESDWLMVFNKT